MNSIRKTLNLTKMITAVFFMACTFSFITGQSANNLSARREFPNTKNGIFIFYDQPPYHMTEAQLNFFANNFTGCQKIPLDLVNTIRSYNDNFIVINYRLAFGTYDNLDAYIVGNDWINDWGSVGTHDDWFVTDPASPYPNHRIKQDDWDWYLMDISGEINGNTTAGWKEYWTETVLQQLTETNCDGVFADSYGFPWNLNFTPAWLQPPDDVVWIYHMEVFGNYVKNVFQNRPENFYFIPNLGPWVTTRDVCDYGAFVDGVMIEMFGSWGANSLFDISDWQLQMNRILDLERRDKIVICQPLTSGEENISERIFNLANYLLIKGEKTYYNLVFDENFFDWLIYLPENRIDLGSYIGELPLSVEDLYDTSTGMYLRTYEKGMVYVNPTWDEVNITIPHLYYTIDTDDLANNSAVEVGEDGQIHYQIKYTIVMGHVTVSAKGGLILLNSLPTNINPEEISNVAERFELYQNYPNPFNPTTTIKYSIPTVETPYPAKSGQVMASLQHTTLKIFDIVGKEISVLVNESKESGVHEIEFDASHLPSGIYFYRLTVEGHSITKKLILMK
ncbi:MAG: putative glycoside hydrolase [bacterium]